MKNETELEEGGVLAEQPSLDELFAVTYDELRRIARWMKRHDAGLTLGPTAVVHEAWLRLSKSSSLATTSVLHFKRIAAKAMRRVLKDEARRRMAEKRGGDGMFVTLDDSLVAGANSDEVMMALDLALAELERHWPRKAAVFELHFFVGQGFAEVAETLEISEATAHRDWRDARAWLLARIPQAS